MISEFVSKRRMFHFPKKWANSVVKWIAGICSPSGTITVRNNMNPGDDGSLLLDVNINAVVGAVKKRLGLDKRSILDRNDVRDIVWDMVDGASVIVDGRRISVNKEWLERFVEQMLPEDGGVESPGTTSTIDSGFSGVVGNYSVKKTDNITFGTKTSNGALVHIACRGADGGENGAVFFRPFTIAGDGRIYAIGAEDEAMGMYTDQ